MLGKDWDQIIDGKFSYEAIHGYSEMEDLKVDDLVYVWDYSYESKEKRHFSHFLITTGDSTSVCFTL